MTQCLQTPSPGPRIQCTGWSQNTRCQSHLSQDQEPWTREQFFLTVPRLCHRSCTWDTLSADTLEVSISTRKYLSQPKLFVSNFSSKIILQPKLFVTQFSTKIFCHSIKIIWRCWSAQPAPASSHVSLWSEDRMVVTVHQTIVVNSSWDLLNSVPKDCTS